MKATQRAARAVEQFCDNRLFEGVDAYVVERIAPKISVLKKQPGEVIFREGQPGESLYLVAKGLVKIAKAANGTDQEILDFVNPGNFFGATSLLVGEPHSTTATVVEPAVIGEVGEETFQKILEVSPARLHMNFLRPVTSRIRSANAHFMRETLRAERLRVAGALASAMVSTLFEPFERHDGVRMRGVGLAVEIDCRSAWRENFHSQRRRKRDNRGHPLTEADRALIRPRGE